MVFTAPYGDSHGLSSHSSGPSSDPSPSSLSNTKKQAARDFCTKHGLGIRVICIEVDNVQKAFDAMVGTGATAVTRPTTLEDSNDPSEGRGSFDLAEVVLYGDVLLRVVNGDRFRGVFMPGYADEPLQPSPAGLPRPALRREEDRPAIVTPAIPSLGSESVASESNIRSQRPKVGRYGVERFDHIVGNLWSLLPTTQFLQNMTVSTACR
jgi:hypothetical protein